MDFSTICVLGLGYIGLPTASTFATHGIKVTGVDVNQKIVTGLQKGELHLYEPGLRSLLDDAIRSGNLKFSQKPEPADAFIIAVPTPFFKNKKADLRFVTSAAESIVPHLRKGSLVVLESTSPPETTKKLVQPILEKSYLKAGEDFLLAYSPERVLPGQILRELIENARVIGGINHASAEAGRDLYAAFVRGEIILTDATTAEMTKLMENTYRDVNIAIANEFSRLADRFHIDVWEAIAIANRHPRVKILSPGPGVGGHCISVDPWFLVEAAPEITPLISTARKVNDSQPEFVVSQIEHLFKGNLKGKKIAALGLSYKADVDDLRESPAVEVVRSLQKAGADVLAYEPFLKDEAPEGIHLSKALNDAIGEADLLLMLVGHREFKSLDPVEVARATKARIVFDCINGWDQEIWNNAGLKLFKLCGKK